MTIKEMRELLGLSQAVFSERYGIPKRSIENWESGTRQCPSYVIELLERCILEDGGRTMKIYEYQRTDGTHYYAGTFRKDESCMWELEVVLPDGVECYENELRETVIEYNGMHYMLNECLLPDNEKPTLQLFGDSPEPIYKTMKILSRRELSSVRTLTD